MRIAHATDIHWTETVALRQLFGKRLLGTANQYLKGRRWDFPELVQDALMQHVIALDPDVFVVTGDLTAQALPVEFEKAKQALDPVSTRIPTMLMPGNHDLYTKGAQRSDRIGAFFGQLLHRDGALGVFESGDLTILALDPNRPTGLNASGRVPDAQLDALALKLADPSLASRTVVLGLHYPILDRHGEVYDNGHHGLVNARDLIAVLEAAPRAPDLIVHGHEHHGFRVDLPLSSGPVPIMDCGSSGYAFKPEKQRAAAMNLYTFEGRKLSVERYLFDGEGFSPEPGGAYATGR